MHLKLVMKIQNEFIYRTEILNENSNFIYEALVGSKMFAYLDLFVAIINVNIKCYKIFIYLNGSPKY